MKKSLFSLFTSLIVCGLLVGSANAMEYTIYGNTTKIVIPNNVSGTSIKRCEGCPTEILSTSQENCNDVNDGFYGLRCSHTYENTGTYKIIYNGNNFHFSNLSLNDANVVKINNFDNIASINNLYINNNKGITFDSNPFENNKVIRTIELRYNDLTSFDIDVPYNSSTNQLYLTNNNLTTIPDKIRKKRGSSSYSYTIKLSNNIEFPQNSSNSNIIDLSSNSINFIGITEINDNTYTNDQSTYSFVDTTSYDFERFGYSYNTTSQLNYHYEIRDNNGLLVDESNGETTATSKSFSQELAPGNYTFKVCYNEENDSSKTEHCDSVNFDVSYYLGVSFTNQTTVNEEGSVEPQDTIKFAWEKVGEYPESFIGSPKFDIELIDTYSSNIIFSLKTGNTSYTLTDGDKGQLENGKTYAFNVYILDTEGNRIQSDGTYIIDYSCYYYSYCYYYDLIYASRSFKVNIQEGEDPKITIDRPINPETGAVTYFSWTPTIDTGYFDFNNYYWLISGVDNSTLLTGLIEDQSNTGFSTGNLNNGSYTFNVMLNYTKKSTGETGVATDNGGAKSFTVAKTYPSIKINRPLNNETGAITYFSWTPNVTSGFSFDNYEWVISGNNTLLTGKIDNKGHTGFNLDNLSNGRYSFNIKMNYTQDSNNQPGTAIDSEFSSQGGAKTFTVDKPSSLKIISPATGAVLTQAENVFSRTGTTSNTFIKYTYSVIGNNYSHTGETTDQDYTGFSIRNLEDGAYTFTVIMHTDAGTETGSRHFTVNATSGAYVNITSPENSKIYTGNRIKLVPINFTWVGTGSSRIDRFTYKLTNTITNSEITGGTINKNSNGNYSINPISLPSGKYKFEVKMLDSNGTTIKDKTHNFTITIPSHLTINTPPAGQLSSKDVTFSRTGFAEFGDHYKYKLDRINDQGSIISPITGSENTSITSFSMTNIHNGKYTFTVSIMNSGNIEIISGSRTFWIPDDQDLILDISDGVTSTRNIKTGTGIFSWGGKSEDFNGYYYSISGTNFKNESVIYTGKTAGEVTGSITLTNLSSGRYRFLVNMLDENDAIITGKYLDFTVAIPASLKITNPSNGSTVTSSSTTFSWIGNGDIFWTGYSTDSRHYQYELLKVLSGGYEQKASSPATNANSFSYSSLENGASYKLEVKLYSGNTLLARDASTFTVSISKPSGGGGGGGGSSSKSHHTNDLSVSVTNDEPTTNERVEVVVDISDKYTGKVDFTKMQYYSFDEEKRIDIPVTSKNYVSDYSDDAKLGYVKFDSSDKGEKSLSEFLMFSQPGNYRIHVEDKDGYKEYTEFYVGKGNKTQVTAKAPEEDEYYIARSCKKYKIEFLNNLGVYTSPNLKQDEYFVSKDYFKRYIDSKNKRADGCPTNIGWITTTYRDTSNSSDRYTAPNGKVYFINGKNGSYSSTELDKELNGSKKFGSVTDLKYFIRDRNPFISMAKLGPTTAK